MTERQRNAAGVLYGELVCLARGGPTIHGYTWPGRITYKEVGELTGMGTRQSGRIMGIVERYFCAPHNLPRLNYLLVLKKNGRPSTGRNPCRADIPIEDAWREVYAYRDWPEEFVLQLDEE
jgi:hypothetical protein